jgi:DNA ligase-4
LFSHHDPKQEDEEVDGAPDRWKPFPTEQVRHCEDLVFGKTRWGLFRRCVIYVDRFSDVNNPTTAIEFSNLDMIDALLRFYGATVAEKINDKTTHVIYDPDDQDRLPVITRFVEKLKAKFPTAPVSMCYVITQDWVLETVTQHTELDERDFFNHSSS